MKRNPLVFILDPGLFCLVFVASKPGSLFSAYKWSLSKAHRRCSCFHSLAWLLWLRVSFRRARGCRYLSVLAFSGLGDAPTEKQANQYTAYYIDAQCPCTLSIAASTQTVNSCERKKAER